MKKPITIDRALLDPKLLGAALGDPTPWSAWLGILRAAFGAQLTDEELAFFREVSGGRNPPSKRVREIFISAGRRSGKSRISSALCIYLAITCRYKLAAGEQGYVLNLAASRDQSKRVFEYCLAFLQQSPILRQEILSFTADEIRLRNNVTIATSANSYRTVRGKTLLAVVADELAYWRSEESALPDYETYRAVLPSLIASGGMFIAISSPYRKLGLLYTKHRDHFGINNDDVLVIQAASRQLNPTLSQSRIDAAIAADVEGATSEWLATWKIDISAYLDEASIEASIQYDRPLELPPLPAARGRYVAFIDPAGGSGSDSYTIAIGHAEGDKFVIDFVRGTSNSKYNPANVTDEYAKLVKQYGITRVHGDAYSAEWCASAWLKAGITYQRAPLYKSEIYLECLPLFTRGLVRLPDHPKLLRELRLLERRTHRSGKDVVDHGRSGTDDHINAVAGVLQQLASGKQYNLAALAGDADVDPGAFRLARLQALIFAESNGRYWPS